MIEENISQELILKDVDEARIFLLEAQKFLHGFKLYSVFTYFSFCGY